MKLITRRKWSGNCCSDSKVFDRKTRKRGKEERTSTIGLGDTKKRKRKKENVGKRKKGKIKTE